MKQLKMLVLRGAAFVLLPVLLLGLAVLRSGEGIGVHAIIEKQVRDTDVLYGPSYRDTYHYYRAEAVRTVRPEVLILGDSRAGQLRSFFFKEGVSVYNACWGATNPAEMLPFLQSLPEDSVELLVLPLSQYYFNANYDDPQAKPLDTFAQPTAEPDLRHAVISVFQNWKEGNLRSLLPLAFHRTDLVGVGAILTESGMLADGSLYSGGDYAAREADGTGKAHLEVSLYRIELGVARFEPGDEVNPNMVDYLGELLAWCDGQGIEVVAFLPPYASTVNDAFAGRAEGYAYLYQLPETLSPLFAAYGFEFYDYTDTSDLGCDDDYFLDGFHAGEVVALRILQDMIDQGSILGGYCDRDVLAALDANRVNNYQFFASLQEYLDRMPRYEVTA